MENQDVYSVKIMKCKRNGLWYNNMIGKIIEVVTRGKNYVNLDGHYVYKEDVQPQIRNITFVDPTNEPITTPKRSIVFNLTIAALVVVLITIGLLTAYYHHLISLGEVANTNDYMSYLLNYIK